MLACVFTTTLVGVEARPVRVEVDVANGLPGLKIVGLPSASVSEAGARVQAALRNSGFRKAWRKTTVNLAPADLKKTGSGFDLSIALGLLAAYGELESGALNGWMALGELALDGTVRPVSGVLPSMLCARRQGIGSVLVSESDFQQAGWVEGLRVFPVRNLRDTLAALHRREAPPAPPELCAGGPHGGELAEVKGQALGRRALEIAAAGLHHLLMVGPPGCGKTMLARCLPSIFPEMGLEESLQAASVKSVVGEQLNPICRPFRAPSPAVSRAALLGGRGLGEVTRAHQGVLFLDEFPEFRRDCIEGLRLVLESGRSEVTLAGLNAAYPAHFTLVAAMNPCPCGFYGDPERLCECGSAARVQYQRRISGPILDRIDLTLRLTRPQPREYFEEGGESSAAVRERVARARELQRLRGCLNSQLAGELLRRHCRLGKKAKSFAVKAVESLCLSPRAYERVLRVARTIADLGQEESLTVNHLGEALSFRESEV